MWVALLSRKPAMSLKQGKTGPRLLLTSNRKSHNRFWLVPKSMTVDDYEQPLRTLFQNTCVFRAHHENLNQDRPHYRQRRCSLMTLVSGNIKFMWIYSRGFPGEGMSNDSGLIHLADFLSFRTLHLRNLWKCSHRYQIVLFSPSLPFHWP